MNQVISIKGARENNLKNLHINIPRDMLTVITGVSGSGKSSLAFDVIYGEGQRKFLESIAIYARRYVPQIKRPDVDIVTGLSPVVAIEQKKGIKNPRSTVGTLTDVYDYLRLLYATIGLTNCPVCNFEFSTKTLKQIADRILTLPEGTKIELLSPVSKFFREDYTFLFDEIRKLGYRKFRIDGEFYDSSENIELDEGREYSIEVVIDKFIVKGDIFKQLITSIEKGIKIGEGFIKIEILNKEIPEELIFDFYNGLGCPKHHLVMGELLPFYFSYNDSDSACMTCTGLGTYLRAEPYLIIENNAKSIRQGALSNTLLSVRHPFKYMLLYSLALKYNFSLDTPFKELSKEVTDVIFYGTKGEMIRLVMPPDSPKRDINEGKLIGFEGVINQLDRQYLSSRRNRIPGSVDEYIFSKHMAEHICPDCKGTKLKKQRLNVRISGKNIHELGEMPLSELKEFIDDLQVSEDKRRIADQIINEIKQRLKLLIDIGLDYLCLNRRSDTISGGESQRIRLSTQISSGLMGMLYVLDEPSIGLHPRDNIKIINTLKKLRDIGNTVIVVEHDMETISQADFVIEIGPGPGIHGGRVVAHGSIDEIIKNPNSLTGQFISGRKKIEVPAVRRVPKLECIKITGASENNLKNVSVDIPLEVFICVTGVSGSGKSSLVNEVLYKKLYSVLHDPRIVPGEHESIEGSEHINNIMNIDQSPIGKSPRSNPATYVGFFDKIRELFASSKDSKEKGFSNSDFSFNHNGGGRCDECNGNGYVTKQLQFLPDVEIICPVCKGARFGKDILEVKYNGKSIADVLDMTVEEAIEFFFDNKNIAHKLEVMEELGLGYIKLGQSSITLSGGEAQRIKLAAELGKIKKGAHNLYILDEPTTGLHMADIQRLLDCLNRLVDAGHTVIVIEHNLDVIKTADYIIDMGPDGGRKGGMVVAKGTPEKIANTKDSYTGRYLKELLYI